jgi:hypothetical protein
MENMVCGVDPDLPDPDFISYGSMIDVGSPASKAETTWTEGALVTPLSGQRLLPGAGSEGSRADGDFNPFLSAQPGRLQKRRRRNQFCGNAQSHDPLFRDEQCMDPASDRSRL